MDGGWGIGIFFPAHTGGRRTDLSSHRCEVTGRIGTGTRFETVQRRGGFMEIGRGGGDGKSGLESKSVEHRNGCVGGDIRVIRITGIRGWMRRWVFLRLRKQQAAPGGGFVTSSGFGRLSGADLESVRWRRRVLKKINLLHVSLYRKKKEKKKQTGFFRKAKRHLFFGSEPAKASCSNLDSSPLNSSLARAVNAWLVCGQDSFSQSPVGYCVGIVLDWVC